MPSFLNFLTAEILVKKQIWPLKWENSNSECEKTQIRSKTVKVFLICSTLIGPDYFYTLLPKEDEFTVIFHLHTYRDLFSLRSFSSDCFRLAASCKCYGVFGAVREQGDITQAAHLCPVRSVLKKDVLQKPNLLPKRTLQKRCKWAHVLKPDNLVLEVYSLTVIGQEEWFENKEGWFRLD